MSNCVAPSRRGVTSVTLALYGLFMRVCGRSVLKSNSGRRYMACLCGFADASDPVRFYIPCLCGSARAGAAVFKLPSWSVELGLHVAPLRSRRCRCSADGRRRRCRVSGFEGADVSRRRCSPGSRCDVCASLRRRCGDVLNSMVSVAVSVAPVSPVSIRRYVSLARGRAVQSGASVWLDNLQNVLICPVAIGRLLHARRCQRGRRAWSVS